MFFFLCPLARIHRYLYSFLEGVGRGGWVLDTEYIFQAGPTHGDPPISGLFLIIAILIGVRWGLSVVLICIPWWLKDTECFLM